MARNEHFLQIAESLKPVLFQRHVSALDMVAHRARKLTKGDSLRLDFGTHLVGRVTLKFGYTGSHPDAPA